MSSPLWPLLEQPSSLGVPAFVALLKECTNLRQVHRIHSRLRHTGVDQHDRYIGNMLISAYGTCGGIQEAKSVLHNLHTPNVKSWNMLITACIRHGFDHEALNLYRLMNCEGRTRPDHITLVGVLTACANLGDLTTGKEVHDRVVSSGFFSNVIAASALVSMYAKCSEIDRARDTFEKMPNRNVITWNTMITAYAQRGEFQQALVLFKRMDTAPDCFTFSAILGACALSGDLSEGRKIHEHIRASGIPLDVAGYNALVSMYVGGGSLEEARKVFDEMTKRDVVSWNAIIVGYVQGGYGDKAVELYRLMNKVAVNRLEQPNAITYASVLTACALAGEVGEGRGIHKRIKDCRAYNFTIGVQNSLVNFYARCGSFTEAKMVFERMRVRDLFSWNSMIAACSKHQECEEMERVLQAQIVEGHQPDQVTYTCILHMYSHVGLVERAWEKFTDLVQDHFLAPVPEHYRIMLDLLGRVGLLQEAELLIESMPFQPNCIAWKSLLSACKNHGDENRGASLANRVLDSESGSSAPYVLICQMQRTDLKP